MEKIVIVGGGIAGLSCLNALSDRGLAALLLEASTIGTPKLCGEFIAPNAITALNRWQIGPIHSIKNALFLSDYRSQFQVDFLPMAGAFARREAEIQLAARAQKNGGRIRENCPIQKIIPSDGTLPHTIFLDSDETIAAETIIFATGKFNQSTIASSWQYYGIKFHFPHIIAANTLIMHSIKNGYLGIVPISKSLSNCTCLLKVAANKKTPTGKILFENIVAGSNYLQEIFQKIDLDSITYYETKIPGFGLKSLPNWPNSYWIGDALISLPPAIGSGFAHAINSGIIAAEYYRQNNPAAYQSIILKQIKQKLWIGKIFHQILLNQLLRNLIIPFLQFNIWFTIFCLRKIGFKN